MTLDVCGRLSGLVCNACVTDERFVRPIPLRPLAVYLAAMSSPIDPEELFDQMVP